MPECADRKKMAEEKLRLLSEMTRKDDDALKDAVFTYLRDVKGYLETDIETGRQFDISVGNSSVKASVDFIVTLGGRRIIAILCSSVSVESRERHILAFSRVADACQIPIAVVTDAETTRVFDTCSGNLLSNDISYIPSREHALATNFDIAPCPADRAEKEKRIVMAFETANEM